MKTITLDAEFADELGKPHHFKFKHFDPTKTADQVKTALTKLTKIGLFEKDGVALFKEVLRAKMIVKEVRTIFDAKEEIEQSANDPMSVMMEVVDVQPVLAATPVKEEAQPKSVKKSGEIRFPEDFTITEEQPKPGWLIKTIQLPVGVKPQDISENQAMMMIMSCLPAGVTVEDLAVDEQATPAKLIITAKYEEEAEEPIASANKESPPEKPKKKRKRLLNRMRKRE
ncbi:hypothetical protein P7D98_17665 [Enterococcus avium]|uniref:DUF2922 family protein n=1 Tax=Enterococcus avium TaxID=33945 RepID=UPI00288FB993|nr:hypothetical protein [Enterococcus avium]MDT2433866.1 hypothetical protein [Enterococcus avium]MDT2467504.1 hypothetical protein [Enterococcus avium]MDT2506901.1 hypothetical protein [Enterococcus avium]